VALQEQSRTMDVAGVSSDVEFNLTGRGVSTRLVGSTVSANLFAVLGRGAARGRAFEPGDDLPGRDRIVLLSHALFRGRFGGDPAVVGQTITLEGVDRQVVGVMPPGFHFPSGSVELWVPLRLDSGNTDDYWGFGWMPLVARLRPGATLAQAQGELASLIPRVAALFPWPSPSWNADAVAVPLQQDLVQDVRRRLLVLQSAVGIVLLIACANVASLLLSRAAAPGRRWRCAQPSARAPDPAPAAHRERDALAPRRASDRAGARPSPGCGSHAGRCPRVRARGHRRLCSPSSALSLASGSCSAWHAAERLARGPRLFDQGRKPARTAPAGTRCAAASSRPRWRSPSCSPSEQAC
jgi:hypothetical protein